MVVDNSPARLQVGDQVPIAVQSAVSVINPDSPIVNSIQYRDTGVILEVVPRVNANGLVFLEIIQEVSDVVPTTTSTTNAETPMAFGDVRKTPQRPGVASRMVILSVLSTQPKISAFPPAVPQD